MAKQKFGRMDATDYEAPKVETVVGASETSVTTHNNTPEIEETKTDDNNLVDSILQNKTRVHEDIRLNQLYPNPRQPRKFFDERKIEELAEDINANGLIEEIVVRVKPDDPTGREIICGERRFRACRLLGWKTIPAQVRVATEAEMLRVAIAENDQHEQLTPYDLAMAYDDLRKDISKAEKRDIPLREFAENVVHRNKDVVQLHFNLLKCDPQLLGWAREDPTVPLRIIDELRRIEDGQARTELMQLIRAKIFKQDEVIALAQKLREEAQRANHTAKKEVGKEGSEKPTSPILQLALRTKAIAKDDKNVHSIITRYRQDITEMADEEKSLVQKQVSAWISELQQLLEV